MAEAALVETDISAGRELVLALDEARFSVFAALWLLRPESTEWTFYIGSPLVDVEGRHAAYARLQAILDDAPINVPLRAITLVGTTDSLLRLLSSAITLPGTSPVRFQNNTINGVLIPDAVIYRLQPPGAFPGLPGAESSRSAGAKPKPAPTKRTNAPKIRSGPK